MNTAVHEVESGGGVGVQRRGDGDGPLDFTGDTELSQELEVRAEVVDVVVDPCTENPKPRIDMSASLRSSLSSFCLSSLVLPLLFCPLVMSSLLSSFLGASYVSGCAELEFQCRGTLPAHLS